MSFEPRRILLIATRRIGDVLLTTPLLNALRQAWPKAVIDVMIYRGTGSILEGNRDFDSLIEVEEGASLAGTVSVMRSIYRQYDLALSTQGGDRAYLLLFAASSRRYGLIGDPLKKSWWKRLISRYVMLDNLHRHTITQNLELANLLGIPCAPTVVMPRIEIEAGVQTEADYVVLHPFPMFRYKEWREEAWVELVQYFLGLGLWVRISGGPSKVEIAACQRLRRTVGDPRVVVLAGQTSFAQLAEMLAGAKCYVGPDTVVTHLAAASGCPTIALFGPSNPIKWGPWPSARVELKSPWAMSSPDGLQIEGNVALLQDTLPCVPCMQEGCERKLESESACLKNISVQRVISMIERMINFDADRSDLQT
jgi:heptosyltransferase-3